MGLRAHSAHARAAHDGLARRVSGTREHVCACRLSACAWHMGIWIRGVEEGERWNGLAVGGVEHISPRHAATSNDACSHFVCALWCAHV